ncbi:uncharacterized protein LOC114239537 [Bombyx mandarina]|uniref:Uncharacterized protein LOC114239537 n=1 Tax=Bombyx mandarina TaxID=7092 RepID=A0A6J2JAH8_BOMMA|nr:uncharacterized protein LOC114239537 [Bombyx mandarina]
MDRILKTVINNKIDSMIEKVRDKFCQEFGECANTRTLSVESTVEQQIESSKNFDKHLNELETLIKQLKDDIEVLSKNADKQTTKEIITKEEKNRKNRESVNDESYRTTGCPKITLIDYPDETLGTLKADTTDLNENPNNAIEDGKINQDNKSDASEMRNKKLGSLVNEQNFELYDKWAGIFKQATD